MIGLGFFPSLTRFRGLYCFSDGVFHGVPFFSSNHRIESIVIANSSLTALAIFCEITVQLVKLMNLAKRS